MLSDHDADYEQVVHRYLTGADIVDRPRQDPSRWTIDFGSMPLESAQRWPRALRVVREEVRPVREANRRASYRRRWWQFGEPCLDMRTAIRDLPRFVIGLSTGKRLAFTWAPAGTSMNNSTVVFAFDDDYSMGILLSKTHDAWAWAQASTLKGDLRYTPTSVFMTFPFPHPVSDEQRDRVAEASRRLLEAYRDLHVRADRADHALQRRRRRSLDRPVGTPPRARRGRGRLLRVAEVRGPGRRRARAAAHRAQPGDRRRWSPVRPLRLIGPESSASRGALAPALGGRPGPHSGIDASRSPARRTSATNCAVVIVCEPSGTNPTWATAPPERTTPM